MEKHQKIANDVKQTFLELENNAKIAKDKIRIILRGLSKEDMIDQINELHLSEKSLNFLCEGIALESEDDEICAAVQQIKNDLQELEISQATYAPVIYYHNHFQQPATYLHLASV